MCFVCLFLMLHIYLLLNESSYEPLLFAIAWSTYAVSGRPLDAAPALGKMDENLYKNIAPGGCMALRAATTRLAEASRLQFGVAL